MHVLLLAGATTQLVDGVGGTALQWAEVQGQPTTAEDTILKTPRRTPYLGEHHLYYS